MRPAYNLKHDLDVTLTIHGHEVELSGVLVYHHLPAERGSRERGSGLQLEPDYDESIEIVSLTVEGVDITSKITDAMEEAIAHEILGQ